MMPSFTDFFRAVWDHEPYPWQRRLAERVAADGWPDVLDLPTGAGKTHALTIALHHLALDGGRTAPRRIVLVVDRRVVVDQVARHAATLHRALLDPKHEVTRAVADRLRALVGPDAPLLQSTTLRGATPRDDAWAHHPQVPVLAASTVDQIGSRLLFRGYGVSAAMRPIHAGLVGCDTLLLLDEVHLARPFADVLTQLSRVRGDDSAVPRRFRCVQLSATPAGAVGEPFRIDADDRNDPSLGRRLEANKPATLQVVKTSARADEADNVATLAQHAAKHGRTLVREGCRAVAIVLNRVEGARLAYEALADDAFDRVLLTGRMRPLDQQRVLAECLPRIEPGRGDPADERPIVVVATQCIEAGADLDFDGMVTECASLDALRQRFGRLDRAGQRTARAVVVVRSDLLGKTATDFVYGEALANTWRWLDEQAQDGVLDFGIDPLDQRLAGLDDTGAAALRAPAREAPVVLPAYLDQWAQTRPTPHADPDVSLFLHGIPESAYAALPDVQIVWRADLTDEDLVGAQSDARLLERLRDHVATVPPASGEALSLAVGSARRWLQSGVPDPSLADVEVPRSEAELERGPGHLAFAWRAGESAIVEARDVRPGDTLIVPATRGGIGTHGTFDGAVADDRTETLPVRDLGDAVQLLQRGRATLRLDPRVQAPWFGTAFAAALPDLNDEEVDVRAAVRDALSDALDAIGDAAPPWLRATRDALRDRRPTLVQGHTSAGPTFAAVARWPLPAARLRVVLAKATGDDRSIPPDLDVDDATTEGDQGSYTGVAVDLHDHLRGVAGRARQFASACSLPDPLIRAIAWAARLHDVGKADPRFQRMLVGGDPIAAHRAGLLAKSPLPRQDRAARRRAREKAGYTPGQRHELVSLDLIERNETLRQRVEGDGADWELVLHLVASHHGWCRPVAPAVAIPEGDDVRIEVDEMMLEGSTRHGRGRMDSGVVDRFWRLNRRYGWHELAYLEAILRLADHRQSAAEQVAGSKGGER